jgi:Sec-independent protein translocase protein TatA
MGMGMMELGVIFVVALLVLGPARSLDMAKTTGRMLREFRRSIADMNSAIDLDAPNRREQHQPPPPAKADEGGAGAAGRDPE